MDKFIFKRYAFDKVAKKASFEYGFADNIQFEETIEFASVGEYDDALLDKALFLSFILAGTSYYKTFPSATVELQVGALDEWQANFFTTVYQEGMSQFAFENNLTRETLAHFVASDSPQGAPKSYSGKGILALQSGGKDSLLTATLLQERQQPFASWYVSSSMSYPSLLDSLGDRLRVSRRTIDKNGLATAATQGGLNGHVPVTYIVASYALIDAILHGDNTLLLSIGHEGEEPHEWVGDLPVNHQWSKTWQAEQLLVEYIHRYISPDIRLGSPLRGFSELRIAELFVEHSWKKYGHRFSSCNLANYMQGSDNSQLTWCGECPKCANSFLLFAPFLPADELKRLFGGEDLFAKAILQDTFKGVLGVEGVMKPFECVGEIDELRRAYHLAQERGGYAALGFDVPASNFDYKLEYDMQDWAKEMIGTL